MKIVTKKWGWEVILVSTELYSCKLMVIKGGWQCSIHFHKLKTEDFILLVGNVDLETVFTDNKIEDWSFPMRTLKSYHIKPMDKHRFSGKSKFSVLLEVATQDIASDSYRETESGRIGNDK